MQIVKIILGLVLLLGGIRNIPGAFQLPNASQAAGYMIPTLFFIIGGAWLLYSGIKHNQTHPKIYDDSDDPQ